jgi:hypothetical protein
MSAPGPRRATHRAGRCGQLGSRLRQGTRPTSDREERRGEMAPVGGRVHDQTRSCRRLAGPIRPQIGAPAHGTLVTRSTCVCLLALTPRPSRGAAEWSICLAGDRGIPRRLGRRRGAISEQGRHASTRSPVLGCPDAHLARPVAVASTRSAWANLPHHVWGHQLVHRRFGCGDVGASTIRQPFPAMLTSCWSMRSWESVPRARALSRCSEPATDGTVPSRAGRPPGHLASAGRGQGAHSQDFMDHWVCRDGAEMVDE